MPKVTTTTSFSENDQLTHTTLNSLFTNSAFHSSAVDDTTLELSSGAMRLKAAGSGNGIATSHINDDAINAAKIADDAVETDQIKDDAVTVAKMAVNSVDSDQYVDGSIDKEHLAAAVISGQTELAAEPILAEDELLISDDGVLKKIKPMKWMPFPKAYGVTTWDDDSPNIVSGTGYNVASVSRPAEQAVRVNFTANMASANYVVLATYTYPVSTSASGVTYPAYVYSKAADHFVISAYYNESVNREMQFVVFGTLAT